MQLATPICGVVTARTRPFLPTPHDAEHVPQPAQSPTAQSTAHGTGSSVPRASLGQLASSVSAGHAAPSPTCSSIMSRSRDAVPLPHVTGHSAQASQSLTAQSMGHSTMLQPTDCASAAGQAEPVDTAGVVTARALAFTPFAPHVALHADHAPQSVATQSVATGHSGSDTPNAAAYVTV